MALNLYILKDAWMRVHPITYRLSALKGYHIAYLKCCRKRNKITSNLISNKVSFMAHVRNFLFGIESHNLLKFIIRIFHLNYFRSNSGLKLKLHFQQFKLFRFNNDEFDKYL